MTGLTQPSSHYVQCGAFNVHYTAWGAEDAPVVIAWHGLARTGRDFDWLAQQLAPHYRVICPDTIGRGLSQWSAHPEQDYCFEVYSKIALDLLDHLRIEQVRWVGTSMGGGIGMMCAAGLRWPAFKGRISHLVLNDMAPELAAVAIERIKAYAGQPPVFDTVPELEAFFRAAYTPFGTLTDTQWRHLAETSTRRLPDGRVTPHYDPHIMKQFQRGNEFDAWATYDALDMPVMILRGANSDLVLPETLDRMKTRGPGALGLLRTEVIADCGHAPALNVPAQWQLIASFLA